jgi:methyl-accepting chemotaxis protein
VGLFENLLDSKEQEKLFAQIKYAQDQSASLSHQLYESLIILDESIESSAIANEAIFENATEAERGSLESKNYVIESNETIDRISNSLKEIAQITHKMIEAFKSSYDKTSTSLKGINHTKTTMEKVGQASHQTMVVMDDLKVTSQDINQIIEEISGIAEQTNLLALNASIEAARAGEMGKGFAVVAEEVRKLSVESSGSAEKIRGLIQALNQKTEGAIDAVNLSSQLIDEGIEDVNVTQDMVEEVMKLQEDTNQYMEKIEGFSQSSYTYGESLNEVMIKIKDQVISSSHQVSEIAKETKIQTQAMEEIASSVKTVEQVSEALKTIR